jgi:hypothetical protein
MAGSGELNAARLRRDLSLVLRRRLTVAAGIGATGLTVVFSLIAATTAPGHATPTTKAPTQPDATPGAQAQAPFAQQPGFTQPGFELPSQPPQSGFGGSPNAISGGS